MTPQRALLADYEDDIFINYDHDDNQALQEDFKGWVDTMHEGLARRLTQLVGEKPKIWRDILMEGGQPLTETIVFRLSRTAFLLSVLSPSYVKSKWCKDELNEFYRRAEKNGGIKINNRSRIFKVVKTPIGDDPSVDPLAGSDLPEDLRKLLQESLGYEFYEIDKLSGKLREFWPELGKDYLKKFLERLEDLAQDIKKFVESQQSSQANAVKIYLAETTPELTEDRNEIKRTLQQHNYVVLPDENLPFEPDHFEERVTAYLKQSVLSIHLIGSDHATVTTDNDQLRTRLNLQYQMAADRVRKQHDLAMGRAEEDPEYSRLLWMPAGLTGQNAGYQEYIDYLQNDPGVYENADVLYGANLEDLKTVVRRKLKLTRDETSRANAKGKRVYLICDRNDLEAAAPLQASLAQNQFEVILPFKAGGQVVSGHKENLRLCDAVLLFYGSANTMEWKLKDLRRIDVFRTKPLLAKGIYVAGPETDQKKAFSTDDVPVMKDFGEFSPTSLTPFLEQFEIVSKGVPA